MNAKVPQYLTKITAKKIGIQPSRTNKPELDQVVGLAILIGIARSYKMGTSEYGEYAKFSGDFEATRLSDGQVFRSSRLILPPILADQLQSGVDADTAKSGVQFAVELGVRGSDVAIGYEWTIRPVGKVQASADPLAALRNEALPALPAPEIAEHQESHKKNKK